MSTGICIITNKITEQNLKYGLFVHCHEGDQ